MLLARLLDDPLGLALGLGQHLLALLHDPARLLDLLGDRRAHLIEEVVDLLLVHADIVREGDGLRVVDKIVELVDENQDVHGQTLFRYRVSRSCKSGATAAGTYSSMFPPNVASSFTPLEERKLYLGEAIR